MSEAAASSEEVKTYPVLDRVREGAHITSFEQYQEMYDQSVNDPDAFWGQKATEFLDWATPFESVNTSDLESGKIEWFKGGQLNVAYNCIDRHLEKRADQTAILWEADEPGVNREISYRELHESVCRMANVLKENGVKKGDRVAIYMPMIPESAFAMLACARIGAIHSVVFAGFSAEALRDRINDSEAVAVMTADEGLRGTKKIPLKTTVDAAVAECPSIKKVFMHKHTGGAVAFNDSMDLWLNDACAAASTDCPCEDMDSEDFLFTLYTSGSTGKPKGLAHSTGGYLLWAAATHKYVFDYREGDIYACVADIGWVTGHSYVVYGPLCNGATTVMFEGIPTYPDCGRYWDMVERLKINSFYTAPTAIRAIARESDDLVTKYDRSSLRVLGTVGEPINPEAWRWYYELAIHVAPL